MFTWYAAVIAAFVVALPLMIKTSRAAIESVDISLIQASHVCGHSEFKTAISVVLPLAKKGLIAGAVLAFARALGEFGATLMIAGNIPGKTNTMPLSIYSLANSGQWAEAHTMVLLLTLMSGAFLYLANRYSKRIV
jgi:molybdate transport system permease protein